MINSHKQEDITAELMKWSSEARASVVEVSVDMWGGFTKVVREVFPNARIVYDRFHVMKALNGELTKIIKQCHPMIKHLKIKHIKSLILRNHNSLNADEKINLNCVLSHSKRLKLAYELKEAFRQIYETEQTPEEAQPKVQKWIAKANQVFQASVQTIKNHMDGICNYFWWRTTSGVMEGINNRIKLIKRQAYGFINFDHLRMRLMACLSY